MSTRPLPAEEAFVVTVGVPLNNKTAHCAEALRALRNAGFQAGATSDDAILALADQIKENQTC